MNNFKGPFLAIYSSPRPNSLSSELLDTILETLSERKVSIDRVFPNRLKIFPCNACGECYAGEPCPIADDMQDIYEKLENAQGIIIATPVYFYGFPSQIKALIDRCQLFWARRYILAKPLPSGRRAGIIAVAGGGGQKVFEGIRLTARYFLDSLSIGMPEMLTFRNTECDDFDREMALLRARKYGEGLF